MKQKRAQPSRRKEREQELHDPQEEEEEEDDQGLDERKAGQTEVEVEAEAEVEAEVGGKERCDDRPAQDPERLWAWIWLSGGERRGSVAQGWLGHWNSEILRRL